MPSSGRASRSSARRAGRHRFGVFGADASAVSEVVGSILMFGIVSLLFTTSLLAFVAAKEAAELRVVELQAESVAHRIAGAVVGAALFYEEHPGSGTGTPNMTFVRHLQLQDQIEGRDYLVDLANVTVTVNVSALGISVEAPILGANVTAGFTVCDQDPFHPGTILEVHVSDTPPTDCYWTGTSPRLLATGEDRYVYLERRQ